MLGNLRKCMCAIISSNEYLQGDYCNMEFPDDSFDGLYALEATVHAKSPLDVYKEVFRVLKPGALFVDSAWAMTDNYNPNNPEHVKIKASIEVSPIPTCLIIHYN